MWKSLPKGVTKPDISHGLIPISRDHPLISTPFSSSSPGKMMCFMGTKWCLFRAKKVPYFLYQTSSSQDPSQTLLVKLYPTSSHELYAMQYIPIIIPSSKTINKTKDPKYYVSSCTYIIYTYIYIYYIYIYIYLSIYIIYPTSIDKSYLLPFTKPRIHLDVVLVVLVWI